MREYPNAEDLNYWKTSKSNPGTWLDRTEKVIEDLGGTVLLRAKGKEAGRSAFLMEFEIEGDRFRAIWPVLPSKSGDESAAERQAATMLYHDAKSRVLRCAVFGARVAFFDFLLLDDGRTAAQLTSRELLENTPKALLR